MIDEDPLFHGPFAHDEGSEIIQLNQLGDPLSWKLEGHASAVVGEGKDLLAGEKSGVDWGLHFSDARECGDKFGDGGNQIGIGIGLPSCGTWYFS
ncbi:MAG TPA: hypothetical protein VK578_06485 [Edaphobacter sp.]|nr:hypothetical protein [Edaphobacter sp.]